jgi:hypothetical protein
MRASLASLAVRLGRTEKWEEVSTADIFAALELLDIFAGLKQMRQGSAKNATDGALGECPIIELASLRESGL